MKYSHIQRFLSAALLLAFTSPVGLAVSSYNSYNDYSTPSLNSTTLSSEVRLTNNNEKITLSLRDSDVKQVLRMFADKAGMNIVFHDSVNGKVTLDLVNTPINDAFNLILQIAGLSYYKQNNTMIVLSKNSEANASFSKQEMMTFPIKYVSAAKIASFLNKNVFGMKKAGMSGVDAATVNAATNEVIVFGMASDAAIVKKVIEQLDREPLSKTFVVNHTTPAEMADMICNLLLPSRGSSSSDSNSGSSSEGFLPATPGVGADGGMGVVTGGAAAVDAGGNEGIKLGAGVVACTISQSTSGSSAPFDIQNLAISYYTQRGTITMMGGSEAQQRMVEKFIKDNDVKQPQAYLELSIVELNEQGSKDFQNIWRIDSQNWHASFDGTKFSGGRETFGNWSELKEYTYNGGAVRDGVYYPGEPYYTYDQLGNVVGMVLPEQVARTIHKVVPSVRIKYTMNYLIENSKARVLANPKLIITNGQESTIDLTQDYVEKVTAEFLSSTGAGYGAIGAVQRTYTIGSDKGIKIALTPFISPEGYVTLNIKPEYATEAGRVYAIGQTGDSELTATLLSRRNLDLKNIRIKDGETLVIGGMVQEEDSKIVHKIPFLGDLPFIGAAFRSSSTQKVKAELVIMITPKIINDGEGSIADSL